MTRDEILNMPAGVKMDALISVKVFGFPVEHLPVLYEEGNTADGTDGWSGFVCPRCRRPNDLLDEPCAKYYSTSTADAFRLMEHFNMALIPIENDAEERIGWAADADQLFHPDWGWYEREAREWASAKTAPLAICRAALLKVMLDE